MATTTTTTTTGTGTTSADVPSSSFPPVVYTDETYPAGLFDDREHTTVFMAGPSARGDAEPHEFRSKVTECFAARGLSVTLINPELKLSDPKYKMPNEKWGGFMNGLLRRKREGLEKSDIPLFNLDLSKESPGNTTQKEALQALEQGRAAVFWVPSRTHSNRDILERVDLFTEENPAIQVVTTGDYNDLVDAIIQSRSAQFDDVLVREGWFDALSVTISAVAKASNPELTTDEEPELVFMSDPKYLFGEVERQLKEKVKGALYVHLPLTGPHLSIFQKKFLRKWRFKLHYATPTEIVYYRWMADGADMVPQFATSIQGGFSMVLSPNHDRCLLVKPQWKKRGFPGGAVDRGETSIMGAARELKEETGVKVDSSQTKLIGGYTQSNARKYGWNEGLMINDEFKIVVHTVDPDSADGQINIQDTAEIEEAAWYEVSYLLKVVDDEAHKDREEFNPWNLKILKAFIESGETPDTRYGLVCETWEDDRGRTKTDFKAPKVHPTKA
jgi:ADP-ribose pyrophosphatase YjhB (NUDIX family)